MGQWDFRAPAPEPHDEQPSKHHTTHVYFPSQDPAGAPVGEDSTQPPGTPLADPPPLADPDSNQETRAFSYPPTGFYEPPREGPYEPAYESLGFSEPAGNTMPPQPRRSRWLVPGAVLLAGIAATAGVTAALAGGGSPAKPAAGGTGPATSTGPGGLSAHGAMPHADGQGLAPPLSLAAAKSVLSRYTAVNNTANARESDALLGTYETQSSFALDSAVYRLEKSGKSGPYPAFTATRATFYIPYEKAAYPHWFVARVTNVTLATRRVIGSEYLVFRQAAAGGPWKDAAEPYLLKGGAAPRVALDAKGYATAVGPDAAGLAVTPARIAELTARFLDGTVPAGKPGNLADLRTEASLRSRFPAAVSITDRHAPAAGELFGLRAADGGALLFYTDAAELTITAPRGHRVRVTIPGFGGGSRPEARLAFLEQFATCDPPRAAMTKGSAATPRIVADYSHITGSG